MEEEGDDAQLQRVARQLFISSRAHPLGSNPYSRYAVGAEGDAVRRMFELAESGKSAEAMFHVGECYWSGVGVARNIRQAEVMFAGAAAKGHHRGQLAYGHIFLTRHRYAEAAVQFRAGAQRGEAVAQYALATCLRMLDQSDEPEMARWLCAAANQGYVKARTFISQWLPMNIASLKTQYVIGRDACFSGARIDQEQKVYVQSVGCARRAALCWMWTRALPQRDVMRIIGRMVYAFRDDPETWGITRDSEFVL